MTTRNHRVRFCDNNLASSTTLDEYSTQNSSFPFTNCLRPSRTKLWKFTGCFVIDATNNKIYINDGSNKTVTLTSAKYTTPSSLATHITTQLNASSSDWTVTYNTTLYRFTIARTGAATLRFSQTTAAAWDTLGYLQVADVAGTSWVAEAQRNHTEEYAIFDMGIQRSCPFISLLGQVGTPFLLSNNATITIQGSNLANWSAPSLSQAITSTDRGAMRFLDDLDQYSYRYWKIKIVDRTNPRGGDNIGISNLYIGDYETIDARNVFNGFSNSLEDRSIQVEADSGVIYTDVKNKVAALENLSIGLLDRADKDNLLEMFERLGKSNPFFLSLDPTNAISDSIFDLTKYVYFKESPNFTHVIRDIFSMSLAVREVV